VRLREAEEGGIPGMYREVIPREGIPGHVMTGPRAHGPQESTLGHFMTLTVYKRKEEVYRPRYDINFSGRRRAEA